MKQKRFEFLMIKKNQSKLIYKGFKKDVQVFFLVIILLLTCFKIKEKKRQEIFSLVQLEYF